LIVRVPGKKGNGTPTNALTEFIDIYPTLANLCALEKTPKQLEGQSFHAILDDPRLPHKDAVRTVIKRGPILGHTIRTDRYRYTEWDAGKKGAELYDHRVDPGEWVNLADKADYATIRRELSAKLQ